MFLLLKIKDICVNMQMEMIHRGKQFRDVGNRGDNWKGNALEKGRKSGIQETKLDINRGENGDPILKGRQVAIRWF